MALIIAVVLIVIVSCRVLGDKAGEWQYEADSKKLDASASKVKVYTDSQLEKIIWDSFEDEARLSEIHKELDLAIDQMEHWKNGWLGRKRSLCLHPSEYSFGSFKATKNRIKFRDDLIYYDRQTALSILLANRGKVSIAAERDGYYAGCVRINDNAPYLDYEHGDFRQNQKEQWFELVEWIRSTLDKQGVHLTPVCTKKAQRCMRCMGGLVPAVPQRIKEIG